MRINPLAHGKHQNLYCSAKRSGVKVKMVMFFNTGDAYIMNVIRINPNIQFDPDDFYNELKESIDNMDFELKTPRKGFMKLKMNSEQFKYHLKDKYGISPEPGS